MSVEKEKLTENVDPQNKITIYRKKPKAMKKNPQQTNEFTMLN